MIFSLSRLYVCHIKLSMFTPMLFQRLPVIMRVSAREPFPWLLVSLIAQKRDRCNPRGKGLLEQAVASS
jgi:hypothetical protein